MDAKIKAIEQCAPIRGVASGLVVGGMVRRWHSWMPFDETLFQRKERKFWYNIRQLIMQLNCERVAICIRKAFSTSWAVCRNVAYPPPSKLKNTNITQIEGQQMQGASLLSFDAF